MFFKWYNITHVFGIYTFRNGCPTIFFLTVTLFLPTAQVSSRRSIFLKKNIRGMVSNPILLNIYFRNARKQLSLVFFYFSMFEQQSCRPLTYLWAPARRLAPRFGVEISASLCVSGQNLSRSNMEKWKIPIKDFFACFLLCLQAALTFIGLLTTPPIFVFKKFSYGYSLGQLVKTE